MTLEEFNNQEITKAKELLFRCCGCTRWLDTIMNHFPFVSIEDLKLNSDHIWFALNERDWTEAFSHHPKIGERPAGLKQQASAEWATQEQSGIEHADKIILKQLEEANKKYKEKFGFIFIVCATGKKAGEMLVMIHDRLNNNRAEELRIAAIEQNKITHLRIDKLLS